MFEPPHEYEILDDKNAIIWSSSLSCGQISTLRSDVAAKCTPQCPVIVGHDCEECTSRIRRRRAIRGCSVVGSIAQPGKDWLKRGWLDFRKVCERESSSGVFGGTAGCDRFQVLSTTSPEVLHLVKNVEIEKTLGI